MATSSSQYGECVTEAMTEEAVFEVLSLGVVFTVIALCAITMHWGMHIGSMAQ